MRGDLQSRLQAEGAGPVESEHGTNVGQRRPQSGVRIDPAQQGLSSNNKIRSTTAREGNTGPIGDHPEWWIVTWHDEDRGCDDRGVRPQNGVMLLMQEMDGFTCKNGYETVWGDVTNVSLNPVLIRKAREVEMPYFDQL